MAFRTEITAPGTVLAAFGRTLPILPKRPVVADSCGQLRTVANPHTVRMQNSHKAFDSNHLPAACGRCGQCGQLFPPYFLKASLRDAVAAGATSALILHAAREAQPLRRPAFATMDRNRRGKAPTAPPAGDFGKPGVPGSARTGRRAAEEPFPRGAWERGNEETRNEGLRDVARGAEGGAVTTAPLRGLLTGVGMAENWFSSLRLRRSMVSHVKHNPHFDWLFRKEVEGAVAKSRDHATFGSLSCRKP